MSIARILLFAAATLAYETLSFAQNSSASPTPPLDPQRLKSIDSFIATQMANQKIPGLAVGIYSRGQILLAKGYGQANVELDVPVKPESIFQSGSVGKQFVSAAIMMLVEETKVSLDDSVTKYFPDAPATWKPILVKNLLSHTSGLSEYDDALGTTSISGTMEPGVWPEARFVSAFGVGISEKRLREFGPT